MNVETQPSAGITCSVIVGLVSTGESFRIFALLDALRVQTGAIGHEVIVADRLDNAVSRRIDEHYPEVHRVACPPGTSLPAMRATALALAQGRYVAVTEDHCIPDPDWIAAITHAFHDAPCEVAAIGGSVRNGLPERALDRATFTCEYASYAPPIAIGPTRDIPGMNVAYRTSVLRNVPVASLTGGFWESTVHPDLLAQGLTLLSSDTMRITHAKHFGFAEFLRQRFWYSRHYGGQRFTGHRMQRWVAFVLTPALPVLLLWRFHRQCLGHGDYRRDFLAVLPWLVAFSTVWAMGEMVGYACGPGNALEKLE